MAVCISTCGAVPCTLPSILLLLVVAPNLHIDTILQQILSIYAVATSLRLLLILCTTSDTQANYPQM